MIEWLLVGVGCTLHFVWLASREYRRANTRYRLARIIASLVASASLAFLAIPLRYTRTLSAVKSTAILLTPGFDRDSVDRFIRAEGSGAGIYTTSLPLANDPGVGATYIGDLQELKGKNIHVFGHGFPEYELQNFRNTQFSFHPARLPQGVSAINWNQKLRAGEQLFVTGSYANPNEHQIKLTLSLFGKTVDSINPDTKAPGFTLRTKPVFLGRNQYQLNVLKGRDTLERNAVPVEVAAPKQVRVLMLASFPDFEHKFLKRWLTGRGYEVVARTLISKNRFKTDLVNSSIANTPAINASMLSRFDLLITDNATYTGLNQPTQALIEGQVFSKGLGLVVSADSIGARGVFYSGSFPTVPYANSTASIKPRLNSPELQLPALPVSGLSYIRAMAGTRALVSDYASRILVNTTLFGRGKIVFTALTNTYVWSLAEHQQEYSAFWTTIFNNAVRSSTPGESWAISPQHALVNEPVTLVLRTDQPGVPKGVVGQQTVYLRADPNLGYMWQGTFWPKQPGWEQIVGADGSPTWWYVYPAKSWENVKAAEKVAATKAYVFHQPSSASIKSGHRQEIVQVNRLYFFLLFLAACGFLWIEKKFLAVD